MLSYPFGALIRFSVSFTDQIAGTPVDPTDVLLRVQIFPAPYTQFTYGNAEVVRDGVGAYHYDYAPPAGTGRYSWEGTGAAQTSTPNVSLQIVENLFNEA